VRCADALDVAELEDGTVCMGGCLIIDEQELLFIAATAPSSNRRSVATPTCLPRIEALFPGFESGKPRWRHRRYHRRRHCVVAGSVAAGGLAAS